MTEPRRELKTSRTQTTPNHQNALHNTPHKAPRACRGFQRILSRQQGTNHMTCHGTAQIGSSFVKIMRLVSGLEVVNWLYN